MHIKNLLVILVGIYYIYQPQWIFLQTLKNAFGLCSFEEKVEIETFNHFNHQIFPHHWSKMIYFTHAKWTAKHKKLNLNSSSTKSGISSR